MADDREPRPCPNCGEVCAHDGWGHVHSNGFGIESCPPRHNHVTRDIKPRGVCPLCDAFHHKTSPDPSGAAPPHRDH